MARVRLGERRLREARDLDRLVEQLACARIGAAYPGPHAAHLRVPATSPGCRRARARSRSSARRGGHPPTCRPSARRTPWRAAARPRPPGSPPGCAPARPRATRGPRRGARASATSRRAGRRASARPAASLSSSHASAARKLSGSRSSRRRRVSLSARAQALRQREVPAGVPLGQCCGLAGLDQPLACVLPDHREQPVARLALAPPRPRRATCARGGRARRSASLAPAHALDGSEVEGAGEDREAAEQLRLVRLEQAVAPVERPLERLLPRIGRAPLLAQQPERLAQPHGDLRGRQAPDARGGQLDRQRNAVEALADARDVVGVALAERRSPAAPRRPDRRTAAPIRSASALRETRRSSASGSVSGGTRQTISPVTCRGSRLVASTCSSGQPRSSASVR